jgi:hypothetical protein
MAPLTRKIDSPSPSANPKKGGLVGRILDRNPPPDHEGFVEARASGFKALKRALLKRKRK